jgi:hypothetical protein
MRWNEPNSGCDFMQPEPTGGAERSQFRAPRMKKRNLMAGELPPPPVMKTAFAKRTQSTWPTVRIKAGFERCEW